MGKFVCDRSAVRIVVKSRQNKSKEKSDRGDLTLPFHTT